MCISLVSLSWVCEYQSIGTFYYLLVLHLPLVVFREEDSSSRFSKYWLIGYRKSNSIETEWSLRAIPMSGQFVGLSRELISAARSPSSPPTPTPRARGHGPFGKRVFITD